VVVIVVVGAVLCAVVTAVEGWVQALHRPVPTSQVRTGNVKFSAPENNKKKFKNVFTFLQRGKKWLEKSCV
jgi:hypothetical protein